MKFRILRCAAMAAVLLVCCACSGKPMQNSTITESGTSPDIIALTETQPSATETFPAGTEVPADEQPSPAPAAVPSDPDDEGDFIPAPVWQLDGSMPSQGVAEAVVFYVDFPDCRFHYEPSEGELNAYCFGESEEEMNGNYPFITMRSFLNSASKGAIDLRGQVFRYTAGNYISAYETISDKDDMLHNDFINELIENGILDYDMIQSEEEQTYVNDENKKALMEELFAYFDPVVDFSQFDGNGDGVIDEVIVCVPHQANKDSWWPASKRYHYDIEVDGVSVGYFIVGSNQVNSETDHRDFTATFLHESGHCMGLPDYYLLNSGNDNEGLHGDAGNAMMDENYSDFCCFSKLMLGWYRERQVQVYDQTLGGTQQFILRDAQGIHGNCLILPAGELDEDYFSEYIILEYITDSGNNVGINRYKQNEYHLAPGVRAYHICAYCGLNDVEDYVFAFSNNEKTPETGDGGARLIRLVNDAEGGGMFTTGDVLDSRLSGFRWYAEDQSESLETGYSVTVGGLAEDGYLVMVTKN